MYPSNDADCAQDWVSGVHAFVIAFLVVFTIAFLVLLMVTCLILLVFLVFN